MSVVLRLVLLLVSLAFVLRAPVAQAQLMLTGVGSAGGQSVFSTPYAYRGMIANKDTSIISTSAIGNTDTKNLVQAFFIWGDGGNNTNNTSMISGDPIVSASAGGQLCEISAGTPSQGLCLSPDNSASGGTAPNWQFNMNGAPGTAAGQTVKLTGDGNSAILMKSGVMNAYIVGVSTLTGNYSVWANGADVTAHFSATVNNIAPALNQRLSLINGVQTKIWAGLGGVYINEEAIVCTGAGAPVADCAGANTFPPSFIAKFYNGTTYLDWGVDCSRLSPTARKPEVCMAGDGAAMLTNKGTGTNDFVLANQNTSVTTTPAVGVPPLGPNGPAAHQATMKWISVLQGGHSATAGGNTITIGDFLVLFSYDTWSTSTTGLTCPAGLSGGSSMTQAAGGSPAVRVTVCWGVATVTTPWTFTATGTGSNTSAANVIMDFGTTVASVDKSSCGAAVFNNSGLTIPALSPTNDNETWVQIYGAWDDSHAFNAPANGSEIIYRHYAGPGGQNSIMVAEKYLGVGTAGTTPAETASWAPVSNNEGVPCALMLIAS